MVRHVAEMDLLDEEVDPRDIQPLLARARLVKALLGSLTVEPPEPGPEDSPPAEVDETARRFLGRLGRMPGRTQEEKAEIDQLLNEHTGGMVTFYDAVPRPGQRDILLPDVINPHYPRYYNSTGEISPSDDQNPNPIFFLTVSPEIEICFPFRIEEKPAAPYRDPAEEERARNLGDVQNQQLLELVRSWITKGLGELGAGAKTSSGYGYFQLGSESEEAAGTEPLEEARSQPEEPAEDSLTRLFRTAESSTQSNVRQVQGKRILLKVVGYADGEFILEDPDKAQGNIVFKDTGVPWRVGQTVKVRVVKTAKDGRILEIKP
jgi:CRISPR type III-B/RAMP module RAMP protein Cmr6